MHVPGSCRALTSESQLASPDVPESLSHPYPYVHSQPQDASVFEPPFPGHLLFTFPPANHSSLHARASWKPPLQQSLSEDPSQCDPVLRTSLPLWSLRAHESSTKASYVLLLCIDNYAHCDGAKGMLWVSLGDTAERHLIQLFIFPKNELILQLCVSKMMCAIVLGSKFVAIAQIEFHFVFIILALPQTLSMVASIVPLISPPGPRCDARKDNVSDGETGNYYWSILTNFIASVLTADPRL